MNYWRKWKQQDQVRHENSDLIIAGLLLKVQELELDRKELKEARDYWKCIAMEAPMYNLKEVNTQHYTISKKRL